MLPTLRDWKREAARDLRALGSPIFYAIVVVRILIDPVTPYLWQLLIVAGLLFLSSLLVKHADYYVARSLALAVLTSLFYGHVGYALFVAALFAVFLLTSLLLLGIPLRSIGLGCLIGMLSLGVGYMGADALVRRLVIFGSG